MEQDYISVGIFRQNPNDSSLAQSFGSLLHCIRYLKSFCTVEIALVRTKELSAPLGRALQKGKVHVHC